MIIIIIMMMMMIIIIIITNNNDDDDNNNNNNKFKTSMIRSNLCNYSHAYIHKRNYNTAGESAAVNNTN